MFGSGDGREAAEDVPLGRKICPLNKRLSHRFVQ